MKSNWNGILEKHKVNRGVTMVEWILHAKYDLHDTLLQQSHNFDKLWYCIIYWRMCIMYCKITETPNTETKYPTITFILNKFKDILKDLSNL